MPISKGANPKGKQGKQLSVKASGKDHTKDKKRQKQKPELTDKRKTKTPQITSCFPFKSSTSTLTSPDYCATGGLPKMSGEKRNTRHSSKKDGDNTSTPPSLPTPTTKDVQNPEQPATHNCVQPCPVPIEVEKFNASTQAEQMGNILSVMNSLCLKVTEMDIGLNHDTDGIFTKLQTVTSQADSNSDSITEAKTVHTNAVAAFQKELKEAKEGITALQTENSLLKGVLHKNSQQLKFLNDKIAMLTAKSMENNITISGLIGDKDKENCKDTVMTFLKKEVEIDVTEEEIYVAHRIGKLRQNQEEQKYPRLMIIRCKQQLKNRILKNAKNLKDKTNVNGDYFYVNKQLPDQIMEENREIREIVRDQKIREQGLNYKDRSKIEVKDKQVYINGEVVKKYITPVEVNDLFPEKAEREKQEKIKLSSSDVITEGNSTFTAYAVKTGQIHEVRRTYHKIRRMHPGATHVIASYYLRNHKGYQDDGEYNAGYRLTRMLEKNYNPNIAVFVVRVYGGIHLGQKRFKCITETATQALQRAGAPTVEK